MINESPESIVQALFEMYGYTFSQRLCVHPEKNDAEELFKLMEGTLLISSCSDWKQAITAARAIYGKGWTTPEKLAAATLDMRTGLIREAGCSSDPGTVAGKLEDLAGSVIERYGGNLVSMRELAGRYPEKEKNLLAEIRGIGHAGADLFFQEMQVVWVELYPSCGLSALNGAKKLGFTPKASAIRELVKPVDFPRLCASLTHMELEQASERVLKEARLLEAFIGLEV